MTDLAQKHPAPDGTAPALTEDQIQRMLPQVPGWLIADGKLTRDVTVMNFEEGLILVNRIGAVAQRENHHPDICIHSWNRVRLELFTFTAHGLSENDFIMAARFNEILPPTID